MLTTHKNKSQGKIIISNNRTLTLTSARAKGQVETRTRACDRQDFLTMGSLQTLSTQPRGYFQTYGRTREFTSKQV